MATFRYVFATVSGPSPATGPAPGRSPGPDPNPGPGPALTSGPSTVGAAPTQPRARPRAQFQAPRPPRALAELVLPAAPRASFASRLTIRRRRLRQGRASSTKAGGQALGFGQRSLPTPAEGAQGRPNASEIVRSPPAEVAQSCPFLPAGSGPLPKSSQLRVAPASDRARGFLVAGRLATLGLGHAPALRPGERRAPSANQRGQNPRVWPPFPDRSRVFAGHFGAGDDFKKSALCAACLRCGELSNAVVN